MKLESRFIDLICRPLFIYGNGQRWKPSSVQNVANNVIVIAARFASQLHYDDVTKQFLDIYKKSKQYQKYIVMEIIASMVYVTMDDNENALLHMEQAKSLSNKPINAMYRQETQEFHEFLAEANFNRLRE